MSPIIGKLNRFSPKLKGHSGLIRIESNMQVIREDSNDSGSPKRKNKQEEPFVVKESEKISPIQSFLRESINMMKNSLNESISSKENYPKNEDDPNQISPKESMSKHSQAD